MMDSRKTLKRLLKNNKILRIKTVTSHYVFAAKQSSFHCTEMEALNSLLISKFSKGREAKSYADVSYYVLAKILQHL